MVPCTCCCFSARSAPGRIQGGAKIGHGVSPSSRNFFFRRGATATNQMHSNDLEVGRSVVILVLFRSQIFDVFDLFLNLVILPYFNAIFIDFYAVKCLIFIYFV